LWACGSQRKNRKQLKSVGGQQGVKTDWGRTNQRGRRDEGREFSYRHRTVRPRGIRYPYHKKNQGTTVQSAKTKVFKSVKKDLRPVRGGEKRPH